jgi:glycosyltransferase involved in cell wall biosynthesis
MNIALITRIYPPDTPCGVSVLYNLMAVSLARLGHEVHVICRAYGKDNHYVSEGVEVHRVGTVSTGYSVFSRIYYVIQAWLKLRQIIKKNGLEVVCTTYADADGLLCSLLEPVPLIITGDTSSQEILESKNYSGKKEYFFLKILCFFEDFTLRRAAMVIANSGAIFIHITRDKKIPAEKVALVLHSVDTSLFSPASSNGQPVSPPADGRAIVLTIGRLESRKGLHILCQAIPGILAEKPDVRFVLVGQDTQTAPHGGSFKQYMIDYAQRAGFAQNLVFVEPVPQEQVNGFYQSCDIYISASLIESFGYTVVEAMACGKPVVATNTGIVPELQAYGLKGLRVVPAGDAPKLSEAVLSFLNLKDKELKEIAVKNREFIEKEFSVESWTTKTLEIFKKTAKLYSER